MRKSRERGNLTVYSGGTTFLERQTKRSPKEEAKSIVRRTEKKREETSQLTKKKGVVI